MTTDNLKVEIALFLHDVNTKKKNTSELINVFEEKNAAFRADKESYHAACTFLFLKAFEDGYEYLKPLAPMVIARSDLTKDQKVGDLVALYGLQIEVALSSLKKMSTELNGHMQGFGIDNEMKVVVKNAPLEESHQMARMFFENADASVLESGQERVEELGYDAKSLAYFDSKKEVQAILKPITVTAAPKPSMQPI